MSGRGNSALDAPRRIGLHLDVLDLARSAGLPLTLGRSLPWLSGRGHFHELVQRKAPSSIIAALAKIHLSLGGDAHALETKRAGNPPTPDLVHSELGCVIEIDEVQHFTSARLQTLDMYPFDVPLGFDLAQYRSHVRQWRVKGDRAFAHKVSSDFPQLGGRQAQRAYNDSLRDLLAPTFTSHPVVRIAVPGRSLAGVVDNLKASLARLS